MTGAAATSFIVEENLETFSLIWLDVSVNNCEENIDAQQQLRTSINFLKTFEDGNKCEEYIRSIPKDDRIVLIISGRFGGIIVARIYSLRQVSAIYVYCAVFEDQKNYSKALEYYQMVLDISEKHLSIDHRALSATHNNIGNVYYMIDDYNYALEHCTKSFRIKSKFFPTHHPSIATALRNIGMVHEKKGAMSEALEFYQRVSNINC